jgi:hypothetical protein
VSWLGLDRDLPKLRKFSRILILREPLVATGWKLGILSTDQFVCRTPGQLPSGYGCEGRNGRFHGGTIYNDAASGLIWVENQVSLGPVRPSWVNYVLSSGYTTPLALR